MNEGVYSVAVAGFKRSLIREALARHRGNVCRTAKALGMHRNSLWTAMRNVGIKPDEFRQGSAGGGFTGRPRKYKGIEGRFTTADQERGISARRATQGVA